MRTKILEVGKSESFRCGFQKATIRDIAKLAGVTTGSIYSYFPNKQALFDALVEKPAQYIVDMFRKKMTEMDTTMLEDTSSYLSWIPDEPDWSLNCCQLGQCLLHWIL